MATQSKRAVGYCINSSCDDMWKGIFLLNHGETFTCPLCRKSGKCIPEKYSTEGESPVFRQVKVEFNYDPVISKYRAVAIVIDEEVSEDCSTLYLESPLIKTEKRAIRVAESILANLASGETLSQYGKEVVIDISRSKEEFKKSLEVIEKKWTSSPRNSYIREK